MAGPPKIVIGICAYNEEKKIASVIRGIKKSFSNMDVLVVDDGSSDETPHLAMEAGAKVILHPFNLGYGTALQTGYKYALKKGYDKIVQMDGDGQHDPSFIADLFAPIQRGEVDIVIGSRFLKTGEPESGHISYRVPFVRRLGMKFFGMITTLLIHQKMTDSTSGYQAMNRRVLEWVSSDQFPFDYPDADVIIMLHRAGFRIKEIPTQMFESQNKKSMHSGWKPIYYIFKMFLSILVTLMRK
jgi:glycosyltransferase involved in cell wall biosynthesis